VYFVDHRLSGRGKKGWDMKSAVAHLEAIPTFKGLSKRDLKYVAGQLRDTGAKAGEDIITEGDMSGAMFIITRGTASVVIDGRTRRRLGPGSFFGEISIIDPGPRTATIKAETDVDLLSMTSVNFMALLEENWGIAKAVLQTMARRLRDLDKESVDQ
jgi:CRP-like cAMP-binding protein